MAAAKKKAAAKAAKPRALDALKLARVDELRGRAAGERHGGTALELRVSALETLVAALVEAR